MPMQGAAGAFQNSGSGGDQVGQSAVLGQHIVNLLGAGGNGERLTSGWTVFALQNGSHPHQV